MSVLGKPDLGLEDHNTQVSLTFMLHKERLTYNDNDDDDDDDDYNKTQKQKTTFYILFLYFKIAH